MPSLSQKAAEVELGCRREIDKGPLRMTHFPPPPIKRPLIITAPHTMLPWEAQFIRAIADAEGIRFVRELLKVHGLHHTARQGRIGRACGLTTRAGEARLNHSPFFCKIIILRDCSCKNIVNFIILCPKLSLCRGRRISR